MEITSESLSDAIKKALKQTIEDLKTQLVDLGIEVDEVEQMAKFIEVKRIFKDIPILKF